MIKWIALFLALLAFDKAADADKTKAALEGLDARINALEHTKCILDQTGMHC